MRFSLRIGSGKYIYTLRIGPSAYGKTQSSRWYSGGGGQTQLSVCLLDDLPSITMCWCTGSLDPIVRRRRRRRRRREEKMGKTGDPHCTPDGHTILLVTYRFLQHFRIVLTAPKPKRQLES